MSVFDLELERVTQDLARRIRLVMRAEAIAFAIADEGTTRLRVAHAVGYDGEREGLEERVQSHGLEALAAGRVLMHRTPRGQELTAPMLSPVGLIGAIVVLADDVDSSAVLARAERELATIADDGAIAIEHARRLGRVQYREELEAAATIATGIANELRNPLFGLSSAAQLLRFRAREDPVLERNIGRILREVERLNGMVTDLLEYGSAHVPQLQPGDPDRVWDDVLQAHRGVLESRALLVTRERPKHHATCDIDSAHLSQAFVTLLAHAADGAPQGSDLKLVSETHARGAWRCAITHAGPAIPPDELARAFDIFSPVRRGGSGIALALARRIIEEHGGSITIDSDADRGTTVRIALPGSAPERTPPRARKAAAPPVERVVERGV
ncbi:MAG TPA: HAMP domain-containing sensor histidine kinase [Gemmatimonadaceae bacterium]|nr:HAMP domain-containing sensor histidine kinase [Gemmatimonadaceae bacterium]